MTNTSPHRVHSLGHEIQLISDRQETSIFAARLKETWTVVVGCTVVHNGLAKQKRPTLKKNVCLLILLLGAVSYLCTDVYFSSTTFSYLLHTAIDIKMKLVTGPCKT